VGLIISVIIFSFYQCLPCANIGGQFNTTEFTVFFDQQPSKNKPPLIINKVDSLGFAITTSQVGVRFHNVIPSFLKRSACNISGDFL